MRCNWLQIIKLGKKRVLELAKELGVFNLAIAFFEKKQRGAYFKCASIVYQALKDLSVAVGEYSTKFCHIFSPKTKYNYSCYKSKILSQIIKSTNKFVMCTNHLDTIIFSQLQVKQFSEQLP